MFGLYIMQHHISVERTGGYCVFSGLSSERDSLYHLSFYSRVRELSCGETGRVVGSPVAFKSTLKVYDELDD